MKVKAMFSQNMSSNSYLIEDDKRVLIDPGMDYIPETKIDIVINTHAHFDHTALNARLRQIGCEIWMSKKEAEFYKKSPEDSTLSTFFNAPVQPFEVNKTLTDAQTIDLGKTKLEVMLTPGHTMGSICLYDKKTKTLFSGDTVFADGVGRTDFPGGSMRELKSSLKKLLEIDIKVLYPGHGPPLENNVNQRIKQLLGFF